MKIFALSALAFALVLTSTTVRADPVDFVKYQPQGKNVTERFMQLLNGPPDNLPQMKDMKVLLVEGIMGNYVDVMGKIIMNKLGRYDYFDVQEEMLKKNWGVDVEKVKIDTEDGVDKNAKIIEKYILKSNKPVFIIGHSKGAMDAFAALVYNPSLSEKVAGMVTIQSPFIGTPIADYLHSTGWKGLAAFVMIVMGGSGEAIKDLTSEKRANWLEKHAQAIATVQQKIPILSFGSYKLDIADKRDSEFEWTRNLMQHKMGVETDGLVPWKSGVLPGGYYVAIEGMDHASPVAYNPYIETDRKRFTRALLALHFEVAGK